MQTTFAHLVKLGWLGMDYDYDLNLDLDYGLGCMDLVKNSNLIFCISFFTFKPFTTFLIW